MLKLSLVGTVLVLGLTACGGSGGGATPPSGATTASDAKGSTLVGNPAPDFSVARADGTAGDMKLADLKGKVVIVDFWATWCKPCAKSFPKYQELYVKYKDKLEIVAVSEDEEKNDIASFGKTHGVKFPLTWDDGKAVAGKYDPKSMPTSFVIDKTGVIRFAHFGYEDGDEAQLERELKELF